MSPSFETGPLGGPAPEEAYWNDLEGVLSNPDDSEVHSLIRNLLSLSSEDRALIDRHLNKTSSKNPMMFAAPESPDKMELHIDDFAKATTDDEKQRLAKTIAEEL